MILESQERGQPVLIGTGSVEESERLERWLTTQLRLVAARSLADACAPFRAFTYVLAALSASLLPAVSTLSAATRASRR